MDTSIFMERIGKALALIEKECDGPPRNRNCIIGQVYSILTGQGSLSDVVLAGGRSKPHSTPQTAPGSGR